MRGFGYGSNAVFKKQTQKNFLQLRQTKLQNRGLVTLNNVPPGNGAD